MTLEQDAREVYDKLKEDLEEIGFPNNCCKLAVVKMNKRGYGIIAGVAKLDNYCLMGIGHERTHYWNYDSVTEREFDITASQFNIHLKGKKFDEIAVWKPGENPRFEAVKRDISPEYVI